MHGKEKAVGTQKMGTSLNLGVEITDLNTYFVSGTALGSFHELSSSVLTSLICLGILPLI